jgi:CHAT domain-containing protein
MGRRPYRSLLILFALLLATAAAPLSDKAAYNAIDVLIDRGEWPAAEKAATAAVARFGESTSWSWGLHVQRGIILLGQAKGKEALAILDSPPPKRFEKSIPAIRRRVWRAWALEVTGRTADAQVEIAAATKLAALHQQSLRTEAALVAANMASTEQRPEAATTFGQQAVKLARFYGQHALEMKSSATVGRALAQQERFDEAITYEERALPIARSLGLESLVEKIDVTLAWAYSMIGNYDRADEVSAAGYAIASKLNARGDMFMHLLQRGNAFFSRDQNAEAAEFYRQAYVLGKEIGDRNTGQAAGNLAAVAFVSRDYETARRFTRESLRLKQNAGDSEAALYSILMDARIELATKHYDLAEPLLRRVVSDAKSKAVRWNGATNLATLYAATGRTRQAEAEFERALDTVEEARSDVASEELRMTFASTVSGFYDQYVDFLASSGRNVEALRVNELSRARTLAEGLGFDANVSSTLDPVKIAHERQATLLVYRFGRERSYLWAVSGEGVALYKLPPAVELNGDLEAYSRELVGPRPEMSGRGERLFAALIAPAARQIPANARVIVVPDGRLNAFNVETLVVLTPRRHYWIEDVTVETAASLSLAALRTFERKSGRRLLVVGDPLTGDPSFPPLPHARAEMNRVVARFAKSTILAGATASPDAYLKSRPGDYDYVHFVAHGTASIRRPLDSAVILSRSEHGYKLYAREIVKQPLKARLVTISSCHGAGVRSYVGEGLIGLAWAFLRAGAHQVIGALWEINDSATPELMDRMYGEIREGRDAASALRDAKLFLLRSGSVYRKPLYWAPFVLYSGS